MTFIVDKIEIYNLAGYKVRTISGNQLQFNPIQPIPQDAFSYSENWWDFRNDNGEQVSSGTYWIKMYGSINNSSQQLSAVRKLILIR